MRRSLLLLALFLSTLTVWAERIDVTTARKVAKTVATQNSGGLRSAADDLSLVYAAAPGKDCSILRSGTVEGLADYFVFNFPNNKGFAIVSGDDRVYPVLGYSDEGQFDPDNLPENLRGMLAYYQNQISWAEEKGIESTPAIADEWNRYLSGTGLRAAGENVLLETAKWDQYEPYNLQTPLIGEQHALTGCVATATAIIMRYHKYPSRVANPPTKNYYKVRGAGIEESVTYDAYDWKNMPLVYLRGEYSDVEANAVAALMWNIGANVEMNYGLYEDGGSSASSALAIRALREVFGYSAGARHLYKEDYRWDEWKTLLRKELDENRPVLYNGRNNESGHAFVCDGYKEGEAFHINWGWGGSSNGYFLLTALDPDGGNDPYSNESAMGIGIQKPSTGDKTICELRYRALTGKPSATETFNVSANIVNVGSEDFDGLLNIAVVNEQGKVVCIGQNISLKRSCNPGEGIRYSCICRPTSLGDGEKIVPVFSLDNGQTWKVMTGGPTAPLYIGNDGPVAPGADNPNDPDVRPINISMPWNGLTGYKTINSSHGCYISFNIIFATEDLVLRFKFDPSKTTGLDIKCGKDYNSTQPVNFESDGSFTIPVSRTEFENSVYYEPYFKISSENKGDIFYDIQFFYASDKTFSDPLFEQKRNVITFIEPLKPSIEPNPIVGKVGERIPFTFKIGQNIDPSLIGKQATVDLFLSSFDKEKVKLFYVDGEIEKFVTMSGSADYQHSDNPVKIGTLEENKECRFILQCEALPQKGGSTPEINISINTIEGKDIQFANSWAKISISESVEPVYYKITKRLTHITTESSITQIKQGQPVSLRLVPDNGYSLPASIEVKVGDAVLASSKYSYNATNGDLYIDKTYITGDVEITAIAVKTVVTYQVDGTGIKNLIVAGQPLPETVNEGEPLTFTLAAKEGFVLPKAITITMGGEELTAGYTYTYNSTTGEVTITNVTGNIAIKAEGVQVFTVTANLGDGLQIADLPTSINAGENLSVTLATTGADYKLPKTISVMMNGVEVPDAYNAETGAITVNGVSGNIIIVAKAIKLYAVTSSLTKLTADPAIPQSVEEYTTLAFTLQPADGYKLPETISVTVGGTPQEEGSGYTYQDGKVEIVNIAGNVVVTAKAVEIPVYTVTYTLDHLNVDKEVTSVKEGETLSFTLIPVNSNYKLPTTITVKVDGKIVTSDYDATTGTVTVESVKGNVEIIANAIDESLCEVTLNSAEGLKPMHINPVVKNEKLEVTLSVEEGYLLPEAINVTMGDQILTTSDYTYQEGVVTIEQVTGAVVITAIPTKKQYDVTMNLTGLTSDNNKRKVAHGEQYAFTLSVKTPTDYRLPAEVEVKMGEKVLKSGTDYTYDSTTGAVNIKCVTNHITIKATASPHPTYTVNLSLTNLTSNNSGGNSETVKEGASFTVRLQPVAGYKLPETVVVTDSENKGVPFKYDSKTGNLSIEKVQKNLTVKATAVKIPAYTVTWQLNNLTTDWKEGITILEGGELKSKLTPKEGFGLPETITVKVGGIYRKNVYDKTTGQILVSNITGNVVITAIGVDKRSCEVTWYLSNVTASSKPSVVLLNSGISTTFWAKENYRLPSTITVMMSNKTLRAGIDYTYDKTTGKFELKKVTGQLVISVRAEEIPNPNPEPEPTPTTYRP